METETFRKGDNIIDKGSSGTCAYIIESGRVEVSDLVNNKKAVLAILGEKQIFGEMGINKFPFKVGREQSSGGLDCFSDNDLYLKDSQPLNVSRNHFSIDMVREEVVVVDRGSRLGTIVNGKKIKEQYILKKSINEITVGMRNSPFVFKLEIR